MRRGGHPQGDRAPRAPGHAHLFRGGRPSQRKRGTGDHWKFAILHATTGQERIQVEDLIAEVDRRYTELAANLTPAAVRGVVRSLLVDAGAVLLKSTAGLYFVHVTHAGDLAKIKTLIERMGHDCELQRHGLLDTPDARDMVTAALEREIEAACASLNEEISKLMVGRTVPAKNYADVAATYQTIARRCEYGSDLLGVPLERASTALERSLEQLLGLRAKLPAKKGKPS